MIDVKELFDKEILFIKRERYFAIIAEHEIIMLPYNKLPIQVKKFNDGLKVTTLEKDWSNIESYREIAGSIFPEYLEKKGFPKEKLVQKYGFESSSE